MIRECRLDASVVRKPLVEGAHAAVAQYVEDNPPQVATWGEVPYIPDMAAVMAAPSFRTALEKHLTSKQREAYDRITARRDRAVRDAAAEFTKYLVGAELSMTADQLKKLEPVFKSVAETLQSESPNYNSPSITMRVAIADGEGERILSAHQREYGERASSSSRHAADEYQIEAAFIGEVCKLSEDQMRLLTACGDHLGLSLIHI